MNISYRSSDWRERILSNLADTPFSITLNGHTFHCQSVEGVWQGLKSKDDRRAYVFELSGMAAKNAGRGKRSEYFEIAGMKIKVGSEEQEELIREAIRQKILQNPRAAEALKNSTGGITHNVPGRNQLTLELASLEEIMPWVLSWGGHARVLEPKELAEQAKSAARAILEE